jgi:hypothetical protein
VALVSATSASWCTNLPPCSQEASAAMAHTTAARASTSTSPWWKGPAIRRGKKV